MRKFRIELADDGWLYFKDAGPSGVQLFIDKGGPPLAFGLADSELVGQLVEWLREWQVEPG